MSTVPLTELRDRLSDFVEDVATTGSELIVTRHGRPIAVVIGYEEYESLVETLNILSDAETMRAIDEGRADAAEGRTKEV